MERLEILETAKTYMNKTVKVYVDRPIGYKHKGILYTLNYGYIKEFKALDGAYQDAYILGVDKPIDIFEGKVIAIIHRFDDVEDKLVVCALNENYSDEEIVQLVRFQEQYFKHEIIR